MHVEQLVGCRWNKRSDAVEYAGVGDRDRVVGALVAHQRLTGDLAGATPAIAVFVAFIAHQQWRTNRDTLKEKMKLKYT